MRRISNENFAPKLIKALRIPENQLVGFGKDGRTKQRTVSHYEVVFFTQDGGTCTVNGQNYAIEKGSIRFHKPCDVVFSTRYHEIYVVHFTADQEGDTCPFLDAVPAFIKAKNADAFLGHMRRLITTLQGGNRMEQLCAVYALIDALLQEACQTRDREPGPTKIVAAYIENHFGEKITLETMAQIAFLHPHYLQSKFKKEMGLSPAEYLLKVRLDHAARLLETTRASVDTISNVCGFCNASYMIRKFRAFRGETPGAYRARTAADIQIVL